MGNTVALLTDFGTVDAYVGIMKAVIASISQDIKVIDINHDIYPQSVEEASFVLLTAYKYFPKDTVFCSVVDPGVGSERKVLAIKTKDYYFVGPDNGLMWMAANDNGIEKILEVKNEKYFLETVSNTFHGRDVFAPVSAYIANDKDVFQELGVQTNCLKYESKNAKKTEDGLELNLIYVDNFGNAILNISESELLEYVKDSDFILSAAGFAIDKIFKSYQDAPDDELFLINGSMGFMEIAAKNNNAADALNLEVGDKLILKLKSDRNGKD